MWPCPSDAATDPNPHLLGPLGHREAIAKLVLAHRGRSLLVRRRKSLPCHHGHRPPSSGVPLSQSWVLFDTGCRGEHVGGDLTTGDLAVGQAATLLLC